jgi:hypothetical protein
MPPVSERTQIFLYFFLPAIILPYIVAFLIRRRNQSDFIRAPREVTPDRTYQSMRHMVLAELQGKGIDLPARTNPEEPYALLMGTPWWREGIQTRRFVKLPFTQLLSPRNFALKCSPQKSFRFPT